MKKNKKLIAFLIPITFFIYSSAQVQKAPPRNEGEGPWPQLIIRGVILIDGIQTPPRGPVDIVVEGNRIKDIVSVGSPGEPINPAKRPQLKPGGKELNAEGMYLMPGFIDTHGHIGRNNHVPYAEYVFKLWLAHGVTTVCDPGSMNGITWVLDEKEKSAKNEITAPRIKAYTVFGQGSKAPITTVNQTIEWIDQNAKNGSDGIKFLEAWKPEIMEAALKENKRLGLRSKMDHDLIGLIRWNVLNSAHAGLTSMEHWYGLPETLFDDRTVQDFSLDYNYNNEFDRFGQAGELWKQAAKPFSEKWNKVMNELISLDFTICPTWVIYSANRDLMRERCAEWHNEYTLPSEWDYWSPKPGHHGSYWFNWGTEQEVNWKKDFDLWMTFVNEYKNRGGRVTVGTDAGFIYQDYGFSYIHELELFREAGFKPLEIIKAATINGAEALGMEKEIGSVEVGKLADLVIVEENPLKNLKVLYGTGAIALNKNNEVVRIGGIKYTIKDGIIYDAKKLLKDVKAIVDKEKVKTNFRITQPGLNLD